MNKYFDVALDVAAVICGLVASVGIACIVVIVENPWLKTPARAIEFILTGE